MVHEDSYVATQIQVAAFSPQHGAVCYRLLRFEDQPYPGICAHLRVNASTLSKGSDVTVASVSPLGVSLEVFSSELALACYSPLKSAKGNSGLICNTLSLACYSSDTGALTSSCGSERIFLLKSPNIRVDNTEVSQIRLSSSSPTAAMLCYRREDGSAVPSHPGICTYMELGSSSMQVSPGLALSSVSQDGISMSTLSQRWGIACFNPSPSNNMGLTCDLMKAHCDPCKNADLQNRSIQPSTTTSTSIPIGTSVSMAWEWASTSSPKVLERAGASTTASVVQETSAVPTTVSPTAKVLGRPTLGHISRSTHSTVCMIVLVTVFNSQCMFR